MVRFVLVLGSEPLEQSRGGVLEYCAFFTRDAYRIAWERSAFYCTLSGAKAVTHETLDQIKLAQHKLIAKKLQENPDAILALARRNLQRYIGNRPAPSLWREWRTLLEENSIDRIVAVMTAKTEKATELRQASPFAGALSVEEIAGTIQRNRSLMPLPIVSPRPNPVPNATHSFHEAAF